MLLFRAERAVGGRALWRSSINCHDIFQFVISTTSQQNITFLTPSHHCRCHFFCDTSCHCKLLLSNNEVRKNVLQVAVCVKAPPTRRFGLSGSHCHSLRWRCLSVVRMWTAFRPYRQQIGILALFSPYVVGITIFVL